MHHFKPKPKRKPRRYHVVDSESMSFDNENPDWLVGAY